MSSSSQLSNRPGASSELLAEITSVCVDATRGDLESRVLGNSGDPELNRIAHAVNALLDSTDVYVRESTAALRAACEGRYYRKVLERGMHGTFKAGASLLNSALHDMEAQETRVAEAEESREEMLRQLETTLLNSAERISKSVQAINDITRGMRMLALNAKVESVRAGDVGRGFGIVAQEMEATSHQVSKVMAEVDRVFVEFKAEIEQQAHLLSITKDKAA